MYGHVSCFFCIVANFIEINFAEKFTDNDLDVSNVKDTNYNGSVQPVNLQNPPDSFVFPRALKKNRYAKPDVINQTRV